MKKITLLHCLLLLATSAFAQTTTQVSTYAGTGTYGRDNGPTLTASFGSPDGICSDQSGNLYIVEQGNDLVRKITPNGDVSTFAGSGIQGDDDGLGVKASFNRLQGICIDNSGNLYVMDRIRISKITPAGEVSTIVRKRSGYQDGPVSVAKIGDFQGGICIDNQGNLFVGELHKHRIRKITPQGIVSTFAGAMDGTSGNTNGTGTDARFTNPSGICADASNNIYVCDYGNNLIRKITSAGEVSTFAGNGSKNHSDGTNLNAGIPSPWGICIDASGDFYLTQNDYHVSIRKISNTGSVTTYAGNGKRGITNGIGSEASFLTLNGICKNGAGEIYVTDMFYCIIRKIVDITPTPPVVTYVDLPVTVCLGSTVDQPATTNGSSAGFVVENLVHPFNNALSICNNENNVFVLYQSFDQFSNSIDSVKRYDFQGNILDSFELLGSLNELIAVDNSGRIYGVYPDANNPSVSNIQRFNSDGSLDFSFSIPSYILGKILAIELGPDGFLYATEEGTGYIRQIDVSSGTVNNLPDPSPSFSFDRIVDIAFDKAGDMILADIGLNKILKRNKSDNNYYPMNVGFDTLFPNTTSISIDTVGFGHITVSSNTSSFPVSIFYGVEPFDVVDSIIFNSQLNVINPKLTLAIGGNSTTGSLPTVWALDSINN
ncbi:MAG: hypothetical protein KJ941_11125, partial [Bacteroidetes bacterium]|nr:hypothetical protein [Bacteroidota bacterium]